MVSCCSILAASLRHRITLQTEVTTSDGQGGTTSTWNDVTSMYASIEPLKAYERYQAMQMQVPITHKLTMRYNADVVPSSRFTFNDRIFWVKEIINSEERNRYLIIKAHERA